MEDAQVAGRELLATTERSRCARTTAMTVRVDVSGLRASSIIWITET